MRVRARKSHPFAICGIILACPKEKESLAKYDRPSVTSPEPFFCVKLRKKYDTLHAYRMQIADEMYSTLDIMF